MQDVQCGADSWDNYFMRIAREVEKNSKCRSRKIGAVLVRGKSVIGAGYNGPPSGMRPCDERWIEDGLYDERCEYPEDRWEVSDAEGKCPRYVLGYKSGQGLGICVAGHAERNALIQAAKNGIATEGATLYCHCGQVCAPCAIEIVNAGISELVYLDNGVKYDNLAEVVLNECDIKVRTMPNPE